MSEGTGDIIYQYCWRQKEKYSVFGFNYELCFTATVGDGSALTQQKRNVYLLQFWSRVAMTHSCVTGCPAHRCSITFTRRRPMCWSVHNCTDVHNPVGSGARPQNVATLESVSTHKVCAHSWRLSVTQLTRPNTSCVSQRVSVWVSCTALRNYSHPYFSIMGIPAHKVCKCVSSLACLWMAAHSHSSPSFPYAVPSIIPSIWQPKPVKKTFLLATVFLKAVTQGTANHRSHTSSNLHAYWELLA